MEKQRITVELDDVTFENCKEKIAMVWQVERKLGSIAFEICVGLKRDNYWNLWREAEKHGTMGRHIDGEAIYSTFYGYPIILRQ